MARKSFARVTLIIILGAMIGSLFGQLLALVLPDGVVREFFLREAIFGIGPGTISIGFFAITLGFKMVFNVTGFIGVVLAIYMLRWRLLD